MTCRRILILLSVVLTASSLARGQDAAAKATAESIYKNFLGHWEGSSERTVDGELVRETVDVVITEVPKKHVMRLDYTYNTKKGPSKRRRFMALESAKEIVEMRWEGESVDRYEASGLEQFARTGLGDFAATSSTFQMTKDGRSAKDRVTFHLGSDTLNYEWANTYDGQTYKTYSEFSFKRIP